MSDDDAGTFPCPNCGGDIYDDSPRCPKCGDYVTPGSKSRLPWWIWAGLVLVGLGLLGGFVMELIYG